MSFELLKYYFRLMRLTPRSNPSDLIWNFIFLGDFAISFLSTLWFIVFVGRTLNEYSQSFHYMMCSLLTLSWYLTYCWQANNYSRLFVTLDELIETRNDKTAYMKTTKRMEKLTRVIHLLMMKITVPFIVLSPTVVSVVKYLSTGHITDSLHQIYPATFIFDWKTPIGYVLCGIIQALVIFGTAELFICTLLLTIGFCLFIIDFISDVEENLQQFNDHFLRAPNPNRTEMKSKLVAIIRFHSEAKELRFINESYSEKFANLFSRTNTGIIFVYLVFAIIAFSNAILQISILPEIKSFSDHYTEAESIVTILQIGSPAPVNVYWLYLICNYGHQVSARCRNINNELYQLDWYAMPLDMQKMLPMILMLTQKKFYLRGIGRTHCTRSLFKKIIKTTFSYFMVLRKFDH